MHLNSGGETLHHLHDYLPPVWLTPRAKIQFILDKLNTLVKVEYEVSHRGTSDSFPPVVFHGVELDFVSIRCNGAICDPSHYQINLDGLVFLQPPSSNFQLTIENRISPARNTSLEGLYYSGAMLCTQNEPEGFRKITYSIDRPDNLIQFQVTLIADSTVYPVLLSNGNLLSEEVTSLGKRIAIWEDPFPKPTYLFALVAGKLEARFGEFFTKSNRKVELRIYTEPGQLYKTEFALQALQIAMRWEEETFGLEYDLDLYMIVAVSDFNMGAMENKGLNIFNSKLVLADKRSATDEAFESILGVVAHEYFHNYTGNRVTLRNWFNLTLKEGLTVFRDQWFTEDQTDPDVKRIKDVSFLKEYQFAEDSSPMSHPILPKSYREMNNFYTVTIYEKGAEVIRMLSVFLGKEGFKKGLSHYLTTYDGQGVTFEEFISSMELANNVRWELFRNWYHRKGTPSIAVQESWNQETSEYNVQLTDVDTPALEFPISLALFSEQGELLQSETMHFKGPSSTWKAKLPANSGKPVVSLFRHFSAPVRVEHKRPFSETILLAKKESDGFSRFEARDLVIQTSIQRILEGDYSIFESVVELFQTALEERQSVPKDFLGLYLSFPSITQLSEILSHSDYFELKKIQKWCLAELSKQLKPLWLALYEENQMTSPNQSRESIGGRRLKNQSLRYLMEETKEPFQMHRLALQQQMDAKNMTEELYPLRFLQELESHLAKESSTTFFKKWIDDSLVLDSWFQAQTLGSSDQVFLEIQALTNHPKFLWTNPNKVRALIGGFARNPLLLHRKDGSGYDFLVKCIEQVDTINPQTAAYLAKQMQKAHIQSEDLKEISKSCLKKLTENKTASTGLKEIVNTLLQAW